MFGIGMPELFVIMAIALIVIGPKKLPDLARSIGRALGEFKKATGELKSSLGVDEELSDVKHAFDDINQEIKDAATVDPLAPSENKPKPTDSPKSSAEKDDASNSYPDSNPETTADRVGPDSESADGEVTETDIEEINNSAKSGEKNDQGETAGDQ